MALVLYFVSKGVHTYGISFRKEKLANWRALRTCFIHACILVDQVSTTCTCFSACTLACHVFPHSVLAFPYIYIYYVQMHSKVNKFRKVKMTNNLGWREY
jgi:hypothetical protein